MNPKYDSSSWSEDISFESKFPSLAQNLSAEVVVVGAGITGVTAAYLLQRAGKKVVLLEKGTIAGGVTSFSTGFLVNATEVFFHQIMKTHGFDSIKSYYDEEMKAIDLIEKIVREENIDCEFMRTDLFYYAKTDEDLELLKKEYEVLQKAGQDCEYSTCKDCIEISSTKGFLKLKNQAKFNPAKYVASLGKVLEKLGVEIYEKTNVEDVKQESDHAIVLANDFEVKAQNVILATHSPSTSINTLNSTKVIGNLTYVIEAKIPKGSLKEFLYEDTEKPYHYLRIDSLPKENFDRIIFGGEDNRVGEKVDAEEKYKNLEEELVRLLPKLSANPSTLDSRLRGNDTLEVVRKWSGEFYDSGDNLPLIGKVSDNIIVCTAYSGSGLPTGTMAAMIAKDIILENENPMIKILDPKRLMVSKDMLEQGFAAMKNFAQKIFTSPPEKNLEEMENDTGEIISINGRDVAVYKDKDGNITKVSPVCTHLGCSVIWNKDDKTWDCPCHGSRFSNSGEVMNGPATEPLEKIS